MNLRRAALALALSVAGCGSGEPQGRKVTISGNSLLYSASPSSFTGTDRFAWSLNAQSAFIRFDGTALSEGSLHATMLDAAGQVVFDEEISSKVVPTSSPTRSGVAGEWQVRMEYNKASGTVSLDAKGSQ